MAEALGMALYLRFQQGLSRDKAIAIVEPTEARQLEAAWKWIDRNLEERIAPVLRMLSPPKPAQEIVPPTGQQGFVPPWVALKKGS